jgi:hypothetical protein
MKIKLIPSMDIHVQIDGKLLPGTFRVTGEWNGLMKLECSGPCNELIVKKPAAPQNAWDFIPPIFGGGSQTAGKLDFIEVEVVIPPYK